MSQLLRRALQYLNSLGWTEQQKIHASDKETWDYFGYSLDISADGNTVVVGSTRGGTGGTEYGAAYIFTRSGGTWTEQQKIQAIDIEPIDNFGTVVAISPDGETVIVGSQSEDTGGDSAGAAYIFTRSEAVWTEQQKLQASDKDALDNFGVSVSLSADGSTAIVGAAGADPGGAAYIFTRSGSIWTEQQTIQASDKEAGDSFGVTVAISADGSTAIVGASDQGGHGADTGVYRAGAAYIFTRSGEVWTEQQKIKASNIVAQDYFGESVSISDDGDTAIVGASGANAGGSGVRSAYIFTRSGEVWTEQHKMQKLDSSLGNFGESVSISGDGNTVAVGSFSGGSEFSGYFGAAYLSTRSGEVWTEQPKIQASDKAQWDNFGVAVSLSANGTDLVVSAHNEDPDSIQNAGAAYIFTT